MACPGSHALGAINVRAPEALAHALTQISPIKGDDVTWRGRENLNESERPSDGNAAHIISERPIEWPA